MIGIKEANRLILEHLSTYPNGFALSDEDIAPLIRARPKKGTPGVYADNIGIGIVNSPRAGKGTEYCGITLFSVQTENDAFYKCPIRVSFSEQINREMIDSLALWHAQYGHYDVGIKGASLIVRTGEKGNAYLSLQGGGEWDFVGGWDCIVEDYVDPKTEAVRSFQNGMMSIQRGAPSKQLKTLLWGDDVVFDNIVSIPAKGSIQYKKEVPVSTLEDLFILLIENPGFMRLFDEMTEEIFELRAELLASTIGELTKKKYRTDWNGVPKDSIDNAALKTLKILQPSAKIHPVSIPQAPTNPAVTPKPAGIFANFFKK